MVGSFEEINQELIERNVSPQVRLTWLGGLTIERLLHEKRQLFEELFDDQRPIRCDWTPLVHDRVDVDWDCLPTNKINPWGAALKSFDREGQPRSVAKASAVCIEMMLWRDWKLMNPGSSPEHQLVLQAEAPPVFVHTPSLGKFTSEHLAQVEQHPLTDRDCLTIVELLPRLTLNRGFFEEES